MVVAVVEWASAEHDTTTTKHHQHCRPQQRHTSSREDNRKRIRYAALFSSRARMFWLGGINIIACRADDENYLSYSRMLGAYRAVSVWMLVPLYISRSIASVAGIPAVGWMDNACCCMGVLRWECDAHNVRVRCMLACVRNRYYWMRPSPHALVRRLCSILSSSMSYVGECLMIFYGGEFEKAMVFFSQRLVRYGGVCVHRHL